MPIDAVKHARAEPPPEIRPLAVHDAEATSDLVLAGFEQFIAADWDAQGRATFVAECSPPHFRDAIDAATCALGAFVGPGLAGVSLMPRPGLLRAFFVHPRYVRRGIGRALWEATRARLEATDPPVQTVELNASPYAIPFYRSIGFAPISREYCRGGCRVTRMACWFVARQSG